MKYEINESIIINASAEKVFEAISKYPNWIHWSPWSITDPEGMNIFQGVGTSIGDIMKWEGPLSGIGEMEVVDFQENQHLAHELRFKKPFPGKAYASFSLTEVDGKTELAWHLTASLPIFMFWMKKKMMALIASDYRRGLRMIREYVEHGTVSSALENLGTHEFGPKYYIGLVNTGTEKTIGDTMSADFEKLAEHTGMHSIENQAAMSVYTKTIPAVEGWKYEYTSALELSLEDYESINNENGNFETGIIGACHNCLVVRHTGLYEHLGNAWTYAYMYLRTNKIKIDSKRPPFEMYVAGGPDIDPREYITDIYIPLK